MICDNTGRVEAALSKKLPTPLGPLEIKAKALEDGVLFALDDGIREVILERDFKIVSEAVNGSNVPLVSIRNIIEGIHLKLREFRKVQVSHVKRQGNCPAYLLA